MQTNVYDNRNYRRSVRVTNFHTSGIQMIKVLLELYDLLNFKLKEIINGHCPNDQSQP